MKDVNFFADFILKRVEQKLDSIIIVDSGSVKGTGKTVFTIDSCKSLCSKKNIPYNLRKLMVLNPTQQKIMDLIRNLPAGVPIHVDETIFVAYKRDYNEDPVKKLVKFVNVCRKFKKPLFLNVPSFWDLDKDIRNLCDFRVTIIKRGIACVRGKHPNPEYEDLWMREESKDIIDKEIGSDITDLDGVIRGISKCKNHLFNIIFPNLPDEEYSDYEKLSMQEEGKQLYLDEKRIYPIVKILSYLLLENSYLKTPTGFVKINSSIITKEVNSQIANSKYAMEFSKFRTTRQTWRGYSREWKDSIERDVMLVAVSNNNNITDKDETEQKTASEQLSSEPEDLLEELS